MEHPAQVCPPDREERILCNALEGVRQCEEDEDEEVIAERNELRGDVRDEQEIDCGSNQRGNERNPEGCAQCTALLLRGEEADECSIEAEAGEGYHQCQRRDERCRDPDVHLGIKAGCDRPEEEAEADIGYSAECDKKRVAIERVVQLFPQLGSAPRDREMHTIQV